VTTSFPHTRACTPQACTRCRPPCRVLGIECTACTAIMVVHLAYGSIFLTAAGLFLPRALSPLTGPDLIKMTTHEHHRHHPSACG
jgi:hypothetical protein